MLRKFVCAVAILGFSLGLALADELKGKITKIDGDKITFQAFNKETKKLDAEKVFDAKGAKVVKMDKKNKVDVAGGLKAEELGKDKLGDKGVNATITTEGDKVTEIVIG